MWTMKATTMMMCIQELERSTNGDLTYVLSRDSIPYMSAVYPFVLLTWTSGLCHPTTLRW